MFSSKSIDNLAFVSRQLAGLLEKNEAEVALRRLSEASPEGYARDVEYFRGLLDGSGQPKPKLGPNPYDAVARLLPAVGDARDVLFRDFVAYVQQYRIVFETYWAGVVGLMWYLVAVSSVAFTVGMVFSAFVVPSFGKYFAQFGAALPDFTQTAFDIGGTGIPAFAAILAIGVAVVVFVIALFHRRIQQLAPLEGWPRWAPIIGGIAELYNVGLFLNYARMLRKCGVDEETAVSKAAAASGQSGDLSLEALREAGPGPIRSQALIELGVAAKLGNLDAELSHQCDEHIGNLTVALVEARDRFSLVLKIALYAFVVVLLIAMYLPIFKMGSVL